MPPGRPKKKKTATVDKTSRVFTIKLDGKLYDRLCGVAAYTKLSKSDIINAAIAYSLEAPGDNPIIGYVHDSIEKIGAPEDVIDRTLPESIFETKEDLDV